MLLKSSVKSRGGAKRPALNRFSLLHLTYRVCLSQLIPFTLSLNYTISSGINVFHKRDGGTNLIWLTGRYTPLPCNRASPPLVPASCG